MTRVEMMPIHPPILGPTSLGALAVVKLAPGIGDAHPARRPVEAVMIVTSALPAASRTVTFLQRHRACRSDVPRGTDAVSSRVMRGMGRVEKGRVDGGVHGMDRVEGRGVGYPVAANAAVIAAERAR